MNFLFDKGCFKTDYKNILKCFVPMIFFKIVSFFLITIGFWHVIQEVFKVNWNHGTDKWLIAVLLTFVYLEITTAVGYFWTWIWCERKKKKNCCLREQLKV